MCRKPEGWFIYSAINHLFGLPSGECCRECSVKIAAEIYTCLSAQIEKPIAHIDGLWSQFVWSFARQRPLLPPHLHRGLNNIIKNDHQRAHCKQTTLVGAWCTSSAEGRVAFCSHVLRQRFCLVILLQPYTHSVWTLEH